MLNYLCNLCRLLVGAPKANNSAVPEIASPGVVYRCDFRNDQDCQEVPFDKKGKCKLMMCSAVVLWMYYDS